MKRCLFVAVLITLCFHQYSLANERLAVMPFRGSGVDTPTLETVYQLLVTDIAKQNVYDVVPESDIVDRLGGRDCSDAACAADIGKQVNATKAVLGNLNRLGEKVIFQYSLVDVSSGATLLSDDLSAMQVEDLDQVSKRIALSIVHEVPAQKTLEIGLVTEQESQEDRTRKANSSWGIGFGYLYPEHGYDNKESIFVWDFRSLYEMRTVTVDALMGIREGFALNVAMLYTMGRKDLSPFIGAGVGFHAVSHEQYYYSDGSYYYNEGNEEADDGFEFLFKAGFLAFRTYDFRVVGTVAFVVTLGVMRAGKRVFGLF